MQDHTPSTQEAGATTEQSFGKAWHNFIQDQLNEHDLNYSGTWVSGTPNGRDIDLEVIYRSNEPPTQADIKSIKTALTQNLDLKDHPIDLIFRNHEEFEAGRIGSHDQGDILSQVMGLESTSQHPKLRDGSMFALYTTCTRQKLAPEDAPDIEWAKPSKPEDIPLTRLGLVDWIYQYTSVIDQELQGLDRDSLAFAIASAKQYLRVQFASQLLKQARTTTSDLIDLDTKKAIIYVFTPKQDMTTDQAISKYLTSQGHNQPELVKYAAALRSNHTLQEATLNHDTTNQLRINTLVAAANTSMAERVGHSYSMSDRLTYLCLKELAQADLLETSTTQITAGERIPTTSNEGQPIISIVADGEQASAIIEMPVDEDIHSGIVLEGNQLTGLIQAILPVASDRIHYHATEDIDVLQVTFDQIAPFLTRKVAPKSQESNDQLTRVLQRLIALETMPWLGTLSEYTTPPASSETFPDLIPDNPLSTHLVSPHQMIDALEELSTKVGQKAKDKYINQFADATEDTHPTQDLLPKGHNAQDYVLLSHREMTNPTDGKIIFVRGGDILLAKLGKDNQPLILKDQTMIGESTIGSDDVKRTADIWVTTGAQIIAISPDALMDIIESSQSANLEGEQEIDGHHILMAIAAINLGRLRRRLAPKEADNQATPQ